MNIHSCIARLAATAIILAAPGSTGLHAAEQKANISRPEARLTFDIMRRADPKLPDLWEKLVRLHKDKDFYTPKEIQDVIGSPDKIPMEYETQKPRSEKIPPGAVKKDDAVQMLRAGDKIEARKSKAQVIAEVRKEFDGKSREELIRALAEKKPYAVDSEAALYAKYQDQPWYFMREVQDARENGPKPLMEAAPVSAPPPPGGLEPVWAGIKHFKIRQSWTDVLLTEDPSQPETARSKIGDLVGASFSYTDDRKAGSNTWAAVGALIFAMEWQNPVHDNDLIPEHVVLAPSVSLNRLTTNGNSAVEIDQLFYRIGGFLSWDNPIGAVDVRAAYVYGTDTGHRAEMPAYEVDIEPQFGWFGGPKFLTKYFKIGYKNIAIEKAPELADQTDNSLLDYQLRAYFHLEGGDLQRAGSRWTAIDPAEGNFLRFGPTLQLRINAPRLVFGRDFSFTGAYSYMSPQDGPREHNTLIKLDATLNLLNDQVNNRRISINANYTKGGMDFTKEDVDIFTLGLSVLF